MFLYLHNNVKIQSLKAPLDTVFSCTYNQINI